MDPGHGRAEHGGQITWRFPAATAVFPHDVWVIAPGGSAASATQVTTGLKFPGDPSVSKTFTQAGTWTFICKLHSVITAGNVDGHGRHRGRHGRSGGDAP